MLQALCNYSPWVILITTGLGGGALFTASNKYSLLCKWPLYIDTWVYPLIGWGKLTQKCRIQKWKLRTRWGYSWRTLKTIHWLSGTILQGARPLRLPGYGQGHLEVPWELLFGLKLKIYVKIIYLEHFSFLKIFWLFVIFGTLFCRKCPFLGNFDQNLFFFGNFDLNLLLSLSSIQINKIWSKFHLKLFSGDFVFICVDCWSKNWFWSKLPKNGHFLQNKVPKVTNNQQIFRN